MTSKHKAFMARMRKLGRDMDRRAEAAIDWPSLKDAVRLIEKFKREHPHAYTDLTRGLPYARSTYIGVTRSQFARFNDDEWEDFNYLHEEARKAVGGRGGVLGLGVLG